MNENILKPLPKNPEKQKTAGLIEKAFKEFLERTFAGHFGKVVNVPDADMIDIIENAFSIKSYESIDETLKILKARPDFKDMNIRHEGNNQWIIENKKTLNKIIEVIENKHKLAEAA